MASMIYLDHAATTPMRPGVWEAMTPYADHDFGNSSGVHQVSRTAKNALEEARERVARLIGAAPNEIVFTSGGTESDNLALKGAVLGHAIVEGWSPWPPSMPRCSTPSTSSPDSAIQLRWSEWIAGASVAIDDVLAALRPDTAVLSVMLVNNETGVIQDVAAIGAAVAGILPPVHTDAVQAFATDGPGVVDDLGVDLPQPVRLTSSGVRREPVSSTCVRVWGSSR
jgi:cysteine desulfurase